MEIVYGPVPSRRLGHSLGINNIPPKICSYSCTYCQVGRTTEKTIDPRPILEPAQITAQVKSGIERAKKSNVPVDYVTFVADGEPTLDARLGESIDSLKDSGIKVAVISNGSLLWHSNVRRNLRNADWVSLKVDAVSQRVWRKINRPHKSLRINEITNGMIEFAKDYKGLLVTETMLLKDVNDDADEARRIADCIKMLKPHKSYLAVPIRPPVSRIVPADEKTLNNAFQIFEQNLGKSVEYLIGYEGNEFAYSGNARHDLLSITAVHPMRKEAVRELLKKDNADWNIVSDMIKKAELIEMEHLGNMFYMRKLPARRS